MMYVNNMLLRSGSITVQFLNFCLSTTAAIPIHGTALKLGWLLHVLKVKKYHTITLIGTDTMALHEHNTVTEFE